MSTAAAWLPLFVLFTAGYLAPVSIFARAATTVRARLMVLAAAPVGGALCTALVALVPMVVS